MSSAYKLNQDLLHMLFAYFERSELLSITLVCPEWHVVAQSFINRTLDLYATHRMQDANLRLLQCLQSDTALQSRVVAIEIVEWHLDPVLPMPKLEGRATNPWRKEGYFSTTYDEAVPSQSARVFVRELGRALPMAKPKDFIWRTLTALPEGLVRLLTRLPACAVHIGMNPRAVETTFWSYYPILNALQIKRLRSIRTVLSTLEVIVPPGKPPLLAALGKLIAHCPQLESLRVYSLGRLWTERNVPTHLYIHNHTQFRAVKSMSWLSDAVSRAGRKLKLKTLELDNFCTCHEPFQLSDIVEIPMLRKLGVSCFGFVKSVGSTLQLERFRLSCSPLQVVDMEVFCAHAWSSRDVQQFLLGCRYLAHLVIHDGPGLLSLPVMETIGTQLVTLHTHATSDYSEHHQAQHESDETTAARCYDVVSSWLTRCPKLRQLTLSTPGPSTAAFSALMRMCFDKLDNLEDLTCYCPAEQSFPQRVPYGKGTMETYTASTCDLMSSTWQALSPLPRTLVSLRVVFQHRKHWDRDVMVFKFGQPREDAYHTRARELRARTLLTTLSNTVVEGSRPALETSCVELIQAELADRHGFSEPHAEYWKNKMSLMATVASSSVVHRPMQVPAPNYRVGYGPSGPLMCAGS